MFLAEATNCIRTEKVAVTLLFCDDFFKCREY